VVLTPKAERFFTNIAFRGYSSFLNQS